MITNNKDIQIWDIFSGAQLIFAKRYFCLKNRKIGLLKYDPEKLKVN